MTNQDGMVVEVPYSESGICKAILKDGNYGDWFILCRTNLQLEYMMRALMQHNIPYDTFKRADLTNNDLHDVMKRDTVKVLTIHAAKGLEAPKVVVIGSKFFNLEEKCISYVAATRAKNLLVWTRHKPQRKKDRIETTQWE